MRFLTSMRSAFEQSLLLRLGLLLGAIATLAVVAIAAATVYLDSATGRSSAINLAGSLRMMTYRVALSAVDTTAGAAARFDAAAAALDDRLADRTLNEALGTDELRALHDGLVQRWRDSVGPASRQLRSSSEAGAELRLPDDYRLMVAAFVESADTLTERLETALERRLANLRLIQGLALFSVLGLVLSAMYLIHTQALMPLADLLGAARALQARSFDTRVAHDGADELGQLGRAFNAMAAELESSYCTLEARVADKTAALAQSHRQLEVLYAITRILSEKAPTEVTLAEALATLCAAIGSGGAVVRAATVGDDSPGFVVATVGTMPAGEASDAAIVDLPIRDSGEPIGTLSVSLLQARFLAPWEQSLLESVAQHVGAALANARRLSDEQRLGLFRERAVIARELHDSLAQSLSYMKIQVARLTAELAAGRDPARIVTELHTGLNSAYRQLRELLTTFRLRIGEGGFASSLAATVDEFAARGGLQIALGNAVPDAALSAAEQIHVLQIVREALANVLHHAKAQRVDVNLAIEADRSVRVRIDDDGIGLPAAARTRSDRHHHGLGIMRDRARTLGGAVSFGSRPGGGTRVELSFVAATPFAVAH